MSWLIIAFVIPIIVAWANGTTYAFAFGVVGAGVLLYFINIFLIRSFIKRRAPLTLQDDSWEATAGTGIVPKWVSVLGLVAFGLVPAGLVPAGLVIAVLLWLGVIANRAS